MKNEIICLSKVLQHLLLAKKDKWYFTNYKAVGKFVSQYQSVEPNIIMAGVVAAKLKLKKQQQEEEEAKVGRPELLQF